jgi:GNAT superfamily N-acetyltransferase
LGDPKLLPRDGLVLELLFDDGATDTSGGGHHGTVHGATPTADRFGRGGAAYLFDGADDYIVIAPPPRLTGEHLAISVWARFEENRTDLDGWTNCVICQDDGNDRDQSRRIFQLSVNDARIHWHRMTNARDPVSRRFVRLGAWHHIVASVDRGKHRLYVDGVLQDSVKHRLRAHQDEPIYVGRKGTPESWFFFHGAIDDVRVYNRALTTHEVRSLYHDGGFGTTAVKRGADPITGLWEADDGGRLELTFDGISSVSGTATAGRPGNLGVITAGTFDRETGRLTLTGEAKRPDSGEPAVFRIEGITSRRRLAVAYQFGERQGRTTLRKVTAWTGVRHRLKRAREEAFRRLEPALIPIFRYLRAQKRPTKAANLQRLRNRNEDLTSLVFRDATVDDIPALAELHVKTWNATYPGVRRPPTVALREGQWREAFAEADGRWFCIVIENRNRQLIGFAKGIGHDDGTGDLNKIYLLNEYQRMGIGRRLVELVARRFVSLGMSRMTLWADAANPSCHFYWAMGAVNPRNDRGGIERNTFVWDDLPKLAASRPS